MNLLFCPPAPTDPDSLAIPNDETHQEQIGVEYLKRTYEAPEKARARALSGHTIMGAFGAAYIGAALISRFTEGRFFATAVAILASILWTLTICLYLHAATAALPGGSSDTGRRDWRALVTITLKNAQDERNKINWKLRRANTIAITAIILSVLSILLCLIIPRDESLVRVRAKLTLLATEYISGVCRTDLPISSFTIDDSKLSDERVIITDIENCPHVASLSIPTRWLIATEILGTK